MTSSGDYFRRKILVEIQSSGKSSCIRYEIIQRGKKNDLQRRLGNLNRLRAFQELYSKCAKYYRYYFRVSTGNCK